MIFLLWCFVCMLYCCAREDGDRAFNQCLVVTIILCVLFGAYSL
jgi:hypothetical protein